MNPYKILNPFSTLFRNLTIVFALLLLIPIATWLIDWHWVPDQNYSWIDFALYLITETGSAPYFAVIVSLILSIWLSMRCKCLQHHWVILFLSIIFLQATTQIIKSGAKAIWEEPRPYMSYVVEKGVDTTAFYEVDRNERSVILESVLDTDTNTPSWLQNHWQNETGYSFPSGHTIFAVIWAFIIIGFLTREKDSKTWLAMIIMTLWAGLMMVSRVRLGMHFPIDLLVSTIIAYIVALLFFYFLAKRDTLIAGAFNQNEPKNLNETES